MISFLFYLYIYFKETVFREVITQVWSLEITHLFHSEWCGDLLTPEDHGPMGQDLGQLI